MTEALTRHSGGARELLMKSLQRERLGSIRFLFDVPQQPNLTASSVVLGCSACSEVLHFQPETGSWCCAGCGCEVTSDDLLTLTKKVGVGLRALVSDLERKRGKGRWWHRVFAGRNTPPR